MILNMTTGKNTSVEFTPACLAVIAKWRAKGRKLIEIVNGGVMAYDMTDAKGREQALDAAFTDVPAITGPSDSALGRQVVRNAAARTADRGGSPATSGRGSQQSQPKQGRQKAS